MPKAKVKEKVIVNEKEGDELRRQFALIAVTGLIVGKLLSGSSRPQTKRKKRKIKRRDYFTPSQYLYRRRMKKARRWMQYGTQSWLKEKFRRAKYQMKGYY